MGKSSLPTKFLRNESSFILSFIAISILIGFFIVGHYGVSLDEAWTWEFGTEAVYYYIGKGSVVDVNYSHGGGYLIPAKLLQMFFSFIFPNWLEPNAWHMVNFLTFQVSIYLLYLLAKKFTGNWGATFAALLYGTQPLFWGHGFINPKDVPFLTLLLGSILFGINLTDSYQDVDPETTFPKEIKRGFALDKSKKEIIKRLAIVLLFIIFIFFLVLGEPVIHSWIEGAVDSLYHADPTSRLGKIFSSIAANANRIPFENYVEKTIKIYDRTIDRLMILFVVITMFGIRWILPATTHNAFGFLSKWIRLPDFMLASLFIGMCMSARALGIIALGIVGLYWFIRNKQKLAVVFILLVLIAAIVGFILWPDLWDAPIQTYGEYLKNIVGFSGWNGKILFEGTFYNKDNYPNTMFLKLIGLQFTIPTLILGLLGMIPFVVKVWRKEYDWLIGGLLVGWFAVPIAALVILHPVIYNNFRHFLFIFPPFFIFAGIAIESIFAKIAAPVWRVLLIAALLLPSILGIVQLHPYEYIYYNEFTGGVNGAFRNYELDYWKTSFLECMLYLNNTAPPNAVVSFNDGRELIPWFAREDLQILGRIRTLTPEGIDYVVISTNLNNDQNLLGYFPNMEPIFTVERDGVPLSVVYRFVGN